MERGGYISRTWYMLRWLSLQGSVSQNRAGNQPINSLYVPMKYVLSLFQNNEGKCVPCECNGRATTCNSTTGFCIGCTENTAGKECDICGPEYYGNPSINPCQCKGIWFYIKLLRTNLIVNSYWTRIDTETKTDPWELLLGDCNGC